VSYKISNEFVPIEISNLVKSKGFDFNCIGIYTKTDVITSGETKGFSCAHFYYAEHGAILFQQIIEWFEVIHNIYILPTRNNKKWGWKIEDDNLNVFFGSVEGGKKENLIDSIYKACQLI